MSEIRILTEEEYPEMMRIVCEAYPSIGLETSEERKKQVERFKTGMRDTAWKPFGVFRDGVMVGVFRSFDFKLNLRGNLLSCGGLGMVAVDLTHKKRHVAKDIVEYFLAHFDERDYPMTTLWPFRVDFYHQMGFGLGSPMHQYRVPPAALPRGKTKDHIRFLSSEDVATLDDCYRRCFESRNGMLDHNPGRWQNRFEFSEKLKLVGCEIDGRLDGYLVFRFTKPDHPTSFMDNEIIVSEFFYHTPQALSELLTFLHSQLDQVGRIRLETNDDDLYFLMSDPTIGSGHELTPTYHESRMTGIGIMYRVMDIPRLIENLTEPCFGEAAMTVKLTLTDSFFPRNTGAHLIRFEGGRAKVVDKGAAEVAIAMDVSEFSSLLMGAVAFRKLHTYGLARISDETCLDTIDRLFAWHQKPLCVTGF